ncbi:hypothetical protein J9D75_000947 [Salmonella enterica]|nr:hypothetical protein [Salmonella enterica]HAK3123636.1 hypothetical protein [Salmonella enterica]
MGAVFPAPAGINRFLLPDSDEEIRVPRASGDKPKVKEDTAVQFLCSPRQRG